MFRNQRRSWKLGFLLLAVVQPSVAASEEPVVRQPVATTPFFVFYSDPTFNLYDALLTAANARLSHKPEAMQSKHAECFGDLRREQRSAWNEAVDYVAVNLASTSSFSRERFLIRAALTGIEHESREGDEIGRDLGLHFLRAAESAYLKCVWPDQDKTNRQWISDLLPRLERFGSVIAERVQQSSGETWRHSPILVDVVHTAGWAGADTIASPTTHIQINSTEESYRGDWGLEMIFHEASHELIGPRNGTVAEGLERAATELGVRVPNGLWHVLLFATVGELTRQALAVGGIEYVAYGDAHGVYRGSWEPLIGPVREAWLPYLRGEYDREVAFTALLKKLRK